LFSDYFKHVFHDSQFSIGLRLPPTGNLSSAMGMKLMLEVKCGKITAERAIEEFRDEWNIISQILSTKQVNLSRIGIQ
jgi:hypothetical protein